MSKVIITTFIFCLVFLQSPSTRKKSDRELDGFAGPVKKVFEEWSPVSGYPNPSDARCRTLTKIYDPNGRLVQSSLYPGSCGSDEIREHYTYDQEGNRTERTEEFQGKDSPPPPPPPMPPPGARDQAVKGPPKTTFKYDNRGLMTEMAVYRANGALIYKIVKKYDEKERLQEGQSVNPSGKTTAKYVYTYEGEKRFPESYTYIGADGKPSGVVRYTDYELNRQGDWVKRRESSESSGAAQISIHYRSIEYFPAQK